MARARPLSLVALLASLVACSGGASSATGSGSASAAASGSGTPAASAAATASGSGASAPVAVAGVDPAIEERVRAIAASCVVGEADGEVRDCPGDERGALVKHLRAARPTTFVATLAALARGPGASDTKLYAASLGLMGDLAEAVDRDWLRANATRPAAEGVLELVASAPDGFAYHFGRAAAAVPLLAGLHAELAAVLDRRPAGTLENHVYELFLVYGGVAALRELQAVVKSSSVTSARQAAVWAVGVANYDGPIGIVSKPAPADKAQMCDWAKSLLNDAEPRVAYAAAAALGRCRGPYIDAALAALEVRAAQQKLDEPLGHAVRAQCWTEGVVGGAVNGTAPQCQKALGIVAQALGRKDLPPGDLRAAMWVVGSIGEGPGQAPAAKALLGKFAGHAERQVVDAANENLKRLR
ncbi:MAG: hypothetical protein HY908_07470 [Myxococcales bacterium]|nr:hypothetical protein [Myxococcales bacterium]